MSSTNDKSIESIESALAGFPRRILIQAQWGDMDSLGHVNNVVFFRWIESSRIDLLDHAGLFKIASTTGVGPILARVACDFRRQVHFPDTIDVGCRVERIGRSSIELRHRMVSHQQKEVVAEGQATIVVFDYQAGKSVAIEGELRQNLEALCSKDPLLP
jgi:acyl-CoA thioester hydrolase